jgi:zinc transport system substrate-binding protein
MKKFYLIIIIIIIGILSLFSIKRTYEEFSLPKVAVTIYPFYDIAKEIIGDKFEIILIAPPGSEPHNFELRPQDILKLKGTKIIFANGFIIDNWIKNLTNNLKSAKIIPLYENIDLIDEDPHFWLSLENMKKVAQKITQEMQNLDPKNKNYYQKNLENVLDKLNKLLQFAQNKSRNFSSRHIITQHNAFQYFAKELNLNIVGFAEGPNRELTPLELQKLIDSIKKLNIKIIFKESQEESNIIKTLAKELNLKIYELDPIEGKSNLDYFQAYKKNIETLSQALK